MNWFILLLLVPVIVVPVVMLWGFAGCGFCASLGGGPPTNLKATPTSLSTISLSWEFVNGVRFRVERAPEGLDFEIISDQVTGLTFEDTAANGLQEGETYFYRVSAFYDQGCDRGLRVTEPSDLAMAQLFFRTVFSVSLPTPRTNVRGFCFVSRLNKELFSTNPFFPIDGTQVKITVRAPSTGQLTIDRLYISRVAATGDPYDPLAAGFPGGLTKMIDVSLGDPAVALPAGGAQTLGPVGFEFFHKADLLIAFDINNTVGQGNVSRNSLVVGAVSYARAATSEAAAPDRTTGYTPGINMFTWSKKSKSYKPMANNLTGDFEAVVQVSTRQINGLLATLHQKGADEAAPLKLLHSAILRVGDPPKPDLGDVRGDFGDWVLELQKTSGPRGFNDLRAEVTATAPPGAVKLLEGAFGDLVNPVLEQPPGPVVRGTVRAQVATPSVSLTNGSSSEVTLHLGIRADYTPDAGTLAVVETGHHVHGEVTATFDVKVKANPRDHRRPPHRQLVVTPSTQDGKIFFEPAQGSNLTAIEVSHISAQVRKAIREGITTLPVDLPAGFPFSEFKGLGTPPGQVIALPIRLSDAGAPTGNILSVTQLFAGSSGFAVAVSKEHVESLFDIEGIRASIQRRRIKITVDFLVGSVSATYTLRFTQGPSLTWTSGAIEISGRVAVETDETLAPNGFVSFRQAVTLQLNAATQRVALVAAGGPSVDESWFIPHDTVVGIVRDEVAEALTANTDSVNSAFSDARTKFQSGLRSFDGSASVRFTAVAITPDGIIIRGEIDGAGRSGPVVSIAETSDHKGFTALQSWIPGGRIERHIWSWVEYPGPVPSVFSGVEKSATEPHRFILPKPPGVTQLSNICLRLVGSQIAADGHVRNDVAGGTTCHAPDFGGVLEIPSWWEPVTVPVWMPGTRPDTILKEAITAHISVQGNRPGKNAITHNTLVYFADWRKDKPMEPLSRALAQMQRKRVSLVVHVVTPAGTFDARRREVEAKLDMGGDHHPVLLLPAEDHEGGWTRTFAVTKTPSAYLINALGKFTWKHEGDADPKELAAALDQHLVPAPAPQSRPLRLAAAPCGCGASDISFEDVDGQKFALHRMLGQEVLLCFWQPWSAPCIKELLRLQALEKRYEGRDPFVVAFHGGNDAKVIERIRKQHGLTFPLVHDTDHRVARKYGVRCWPTTVSISAHGQVGHVQFGMSHEHDRAPECNTKPAS